ncbi:protein ACCELERATED CELL DEATH 6-like [Ziziphus jujuba]|uniref:Protein ACCELERATED CELL DEATH 6-like n=1 Tax=Ziziphus jujuba TaxID=326968 RepID=A0ABM4A7F1_ZIZJJ|nr:protein ACCELERATED CELL DEATH 6-like [Ziziphus jujuba]
MNRKPAKPMLQIGDEVKVQCPAADDIQMYPVISEQDGNSPGHRPTISQCPAVDDIEMDSEISEQDGNSPEHTSQTMCLRTTMNRRAAKPMLQTGGAVMLQCPAVDDMRIYHRICISEHGKPLEPKGSISSSEPAKYEIIRNQMKHRNMDFTQFYRAVTTNDIDSFHRLSTNLDLEISLFEQQASREDTLLHIAASLGYHLLVEEILMKFPELVKFTNSAGNLPLHVAASSGHLATLEILLVHGEKVNLSDSCSTSTSTSSNNLPLIRVTNNEKETALHLALKNRHNVIARMLFDKDPKVTHDVNSEGKSPLYMAAEARYMELFKAMMEHQDGNNPDDLMKQKILHVCFAGKIGAPGILDILLLKWKSAFTSVDESGRNPLSYAALVGYTEGVRRILNEFRESSYVADEKGFFPIHMASSKGHIDIIKEFLLHCPDSRELNNNQNQNILHLAAENGRAKAVRYMLKNPQLQILINERDCKGNTPLHLATKGSHPMVVSILTWDSRIDLQLMNKEGKTALDVALSFSTRMPSFRERLTWQALRHAGARRAQSTIVGMPIEPQNSKPEENTGKQVQTQTPDTEFYKDRANTLLLVATLIVTVTFAAGFSVPGKDDDSSEPSHGIMRNAVYNKFMFHTYIISNYIAFYSSSTAAVAIISLKFAVTLLGLALTMVSTAFMAGVHLVVSKNIGLAIFVLVMGLIGILAISMVFAPLFFPSSSLHRITRYILYYPFHLLVIVTRSDVDDNDKI